jgi:hypothetical protein
MPVSAPSVFLLLKSGQIRVRIPLTIIPLPSQMLILLCDLPGLAANPESETVVFCSAPAERSGDGALGFVQAAK